MTEARRRAIRMNPDAPEAEAPRAEAEAIKAFREIVKAVPKAVRVLAQARIELVAKALGDEGQELGKPKPRRY